MIKGDLNAETAAMKQMLLDVRNGAIVALCGQIIDDTPVDTGALRGSWRSANGAPNLDSSIRIAPDGDASEAKEELADVVAANKGEETICFSNTLPYAEEIEFDGKSPVKAPEGMVRKNLPSWPGLVAKFSSSRGEASW